MEQIGNQPEYAELRDKLANEQFTVSYVDPNTGATITYSIPLFQYDNARAIIDGATYIDGTYQLTERGMGLIQASGDAVEIIAGGASCVGVVTCAAGTIVASSGFDNLYAGSNTVVTGKYTKTVGAELLETLGVPPEYSEVVYTGVNLAGTTTLVSKSAKIGEMITTTVSTEGKVSREIGNNWTVDKNGAYSPKDNGTVTNVGKYDRNSLPYDKTNEINKLIPENLTNKIAEHNTQLGVLNRRQGTISGAHKQNALLESVEMTGAKINLTITDKKYPGLVEYQYQIPAVNGRGQEIGFKAVQTKTTYDPTVLSDSKINDMSYKASQKAESFFKNNPDYRQYSAQVDGYWFQVTRDAKTGEINNAFITMPPRDKK